MKVIHEQPISEQIVDAKYEADVRGKVIDYIELTGREWERLRAEVRRTCFIPPDNDPHFTDLKDGYVGRFDGVLLSVKNDSGLDHNDDLSEVARQYEKFKDSITSYPYQGSIEELAFAINKSTASALGAINATERGGKPVLEVKTHSVECWPEGKGVGRVNFFAKNNGSLKECMKILIEDIVRHYKEQTK